MYFGCAEHDQWAPPEMIDALDAHLKDAGINYRIEWYQAPSTVLSFHNAVTSIKRLPLNDIGKCCLPCCGVTSVNCS